MLLAWLLACNEDGTPIGAGSAPAAAEGIVVSAEGYEGRAKAAWAATQKATLTGKGVDVVKKVGTKVMVDVPGALTGLPEGIEAVSFDAMPEVRAALFGTDEAKAADAVRAAGAKVLIVHTDIRPSFDRDGHVLSRLYHHDFLERFQLARVEDNALVYLVVDAPLAFPPDMAAASVRWIREALAGRKPAPFPPVQPERSNWTLVTVLRGNGHEGAVSLAEADTLDRALIEAATDLEAGWRRNREVLGLPRIEKAIDGLRLEIHRVRESADVVPRDEKALADLWEMGVDGAIIRDRTGDKRQAGTWPGSLAVTHGITTADSFLRAIARDVRWDSVRPWRDEEVELNLIRTVHYLEVPGKGVVPMVRGTSAVPLEAVTLESTRSAIVYSGEWYLQNLKPDGSVTYKMWPEDNRYSNENNHVRHELSTWNLVQAWHLDPRPEFLEGARRSLAFTNRFLVERDARSFEPWERAKIDASPLKEEIYAEGMAYYNYADVNKLGSVVVGLMGMIDLARATNDHSYDPLMRKLGRFVLFSQEEDGRVRPYHVPPGHRYEKEKNDIVPGEAALSLVMLSEWLQDPRYLDALPKFFAYYKPWYDERAKRRSTAGPWPGYLYDNQTRLDLVQFGPWTVMAADAYTRNRPEATDIVDFGLEVARWMVESYAYTTERSPWPDYVGGYYKFDGELPAMQAYCYGEGTAAAYAMALRTGRKDEARYFEKVTRETVRLAMQMQHDGLDTYAFARGEEVEGGVKYALNEPKVRIDYVYHAQSTLWQYLKAAQTDPDLPEVVKAPPAEPLRALFALQEMPFYRAADVPVRTSVPPAGAAGTPMPTASEVVDDADGGE